MKAKVYWKENLSFEGFAQSGHKIFMDSVPEKMLSIGPSPKELILQALAGCTMMNVIGVLKKARKKIHKFWLDIDSELSAEIPNPFKKIHLNYNFIADDLTDYFAMNAINLSLDKYCAVGAILKGNVEITYSFKVTKSIPSARSHPHLILSAVFDEIY